MDDLPSELHFRFLLEAHDNDLPGMCRMNQHYANLCEADWFWKERTKLNYEPFLYLKDNFRKYRDLYRELSKRALYIVLPHIAHSSHGYRIFNNIEDAYNYLKRNMSFIPPIDKVRRPAYSFNSIYIIFEEEGITPRRTDNLLYGIIPGEGYPWNTESLDFYIHPQLADLPSFSREGKYITFNRTNLVDRGSPVTYVGRETNRFLLTIFKEVDRKALGMDNFMIRYVNDPDHNETFKYWRDLRMFVRAKFPLVFVDRIDDDIEFMVMPEEYYGTFSQESDGVTNIEIPKVREIFEEIKDKSRWRSMREGYIFPPEDRTHINYSYYSDDNSYGDYQ